MKINAAAVAALCCVLAVGPVMGDVFTAMVDIENMLKNEAEATTLILDRYLQAETERLEQIRT